jgi:hypothetical protein
MGPGDAWSGGMRSGGTGNRATPRGVDCGATTVLGEGGGGGATAHGATIRVKLLGTWNYLVCGEGIRAPVRNRYEHRLAQYIYRLTDEYTFIG